MDSILLITDGPNDTHVHLREPGAVQKEDLVSGTASALARGITMVYLIPNTNPSIADETILSFVKDLARNKAKSLSITCEVYPYHLFLTKEDFEKLAEKKVQVRPILGSKDDQQALWDNINIIDCIATDYGPHTLAEKTGSKEPPVGLETMHYNQQKVFGLPEQPDNYIKIDMNQEWTFEDKPLHSKVGGTHFALRRVILRGEGFFIDGKVLVKPGFSQDVRLWNQEYQGLRMPKHLFAKHEIRSQTSGIRVESGLFDGERKRYDNGDVQLKQRTDSALCPSSPLPLTHFLMKSAQREDGLLVQRKGQFPSKVN